MSPVLVTIIPWILQIITTHFLTPGNISLGEKAILHFLLGQVKALEANTKDETVLATEKMAEAFLVAAGAT